MNKILLYKVAIAVLSGLALIACAGPSRGTVTDPKAPVLHEPLATGHGEVGPGVPAFWVRPGFRVTVAVDQLDGARFMAFDDKNLLYVSRPDIGDILVFRSVDGEYRQVNTFVSDMHQVQAMQFLDGWMWFATSRGIFRAHTTGEGKASYLQTIIPEGGLPGGSGHWWRSLFVAPDGFYTSVGDTGNITDLTDSDREKIWKYSLDGKQRQLWSSGIRNTEKLLFRPGTTELWGADQGSDWFGKELGDRQGLQPITDFNPPDEFNLYIKGGFYGHPFISGYRTPRPEYYNRKDIIELAARTIVPEWNMGAHTAVDSWCFLEKPGMFPAEWTGDAMMAEHGSWNHSHKVGYQITHVFFDKVTGKPYGAQNLVVTRTEDEKVLARPVDVEMAPDGTLLFTSDAPGKIFRISPVKG